MRLLYINHPIFQTVSGKLSLSHYCELFTMLDSDKYSFYEKETMPIKNIITSPYVPNKDQLIR